MNLIQYNNRLCLPNKWKESLGHNLCITISFIPPIEILINTFKLTRIRLPLYHIAWFSPHLVPTLHTHPLPRILTLIQRQLLDLLMTNDFVHAFGCHLPYPHKFVIPTIFVFFFLHYIVYHLLLYACQMSLDSRYRLLTISNNTIVLSSIYFSRIFCFKIRSQWILIPF